LVILQHLAFSSQPSGYSDQQEAKGQRLKADGWKLIAVLQRRIKLYESWTWNYAGRFGRSASRGPHDLWQLCERQKSNGG
jgi:hypothetical protein